MPRKPLFAALLAVLLFSVLPAAGSSAGRSAESSAERSDAKRYAWERRRTGRLIPTDAVLCYGQSHHRKPYAWDEAHFEPYVTYVDTTGREQWLFDGFIFLESQDMERPDKRNYTYMTGVLRDRGLSAGRAQWENLLDYWFDGERNLAALDRAVHAAVKRLGKPAAKRRVVMMIPDPIIYHHWIDSMTSTTYWGEVEGRRLDFRRTEDRFAACKWFVDQVRERFDRAGYRHLELAGFYWLRENIAQPQDTEYSYYLTRSDVLLPLIADYLHGLNYTFNWIPFYDARGYEDWPKFGFDKVYLQLNHYWKPENDVDVACRRIREFGTSIEFEFESSILNAREGSDVYRERFRDYMRGARRYGIYGTQPLAYYQGYMSLYDLWVSEDPVDRAFFHEFCRFVVNNPLREENRP